MSEVTAPAWLCDVCGHLWIKNPDVYPVHCARCKTRRWNKDARPAAGPAAGENRAPLVIGPESARRLAELEDAGGGFIGAGATPYNLLVSAIANAQAKEKTGPGAGYTVADASAADRPAVHAANLGAAAVRPAHVAGCNCFRCQRRRG